MDEQQNAAAGANAEQSTGPVITGGGSGIGRAMAERFAAAGMHIVLADVDEVALFCEQVVADAKAVLESLEDEVVSLLPENIPGEVRTAIHRKVRQMRDEKLWQLSRLIEGDTDEAGDEDEDHGRRWAARYGELYRAWEQYKE